MSSIGYCLGIVAPYYNLALVIIVTILFLRLFSLSNKGVYIKPWKILFLAILVYIVEEIINIMETANLITVSSLLFPFLEMIIISLFIYMLLLQKEHTKK